MVETESNVRIRLANVINIYQQAKRSGETESEVRSIELIIKNKQPRVKVINKDGWKLLGFTKRENKLKTCKQEILTIRLIILKSLMSEMVVFTNKLGKNLTWKNLAKPLNFIVAQCKICKEAWPVKSSLKRFEKYICQRCSRDKKSPRKFSFENSMIPSAQPVQLPDLSQVEEMLIAQALPAMRVYIKLGGQRGYSGHCLNLPQKITELQHCHDVPKHYL